MLEENSKQSGRIMQWLTWKKEKERLVGSIYRKEGIKPSTKE